MLQPRSFGITYPYTPADEELLGQFVEPFPESKPDFITDFLGIRTNVAFFPQAAARSGEVVRGVPIPDDTVHAQGIEYLSLAQALSEAPEKEVCIVEVGAGWGPWICAGALIARRMHKRSRLLASEMLPDKIEHIFAHLAENGVYNDDDKSLGVWHSGPDDTLKIVRAVVDAKDGIAYVPIVDGTQDHGARPSAVATDMDYRGHPIQTEPLEPVMNSTSGSGRMEYEYTPRLSFRCHRR